MVLCEAMETSNSECTLPTQLVASRSYITALLKLVMECLQHQQEDRPEMLRVYNELTSMKRRVMRRTEKHGTKLRHTAGFTFGDGCEIPDCSEMFSPLHERDPTMVLEAGAAAEELL